MNDASVPEPRTKAMSSWGLLAGIVGSFCCLGPSTAVLFGLGSSSALFSLQFDQTLTFALSGTLLLGGVVRALWHAQTSTICRRARWRQPLIMLATFAVSYGLLGLLLPLLAAQQEDRVGATQIAAAVPAQMVLDQELPKAPELHRLTLIIEKMNCPPCAAKIRNRLRGKPAVQSVRAEAYNEEVIITYDPQQSTGEALMKMIPRQYGVTLVRDEPLP